MKKSDRIKTIDVCPFIIRINIDRLTTDFDTYKETDKFPMHVKSDIILNMQMLADSFKYEMISERTFLKLESELRSLRDSLICKYSEVQHLCRKNENLVKERMEKLEVISNRSEHVTELQARLFIVTEHLNGTLTLAWRPNIKDGITANRYAPYFSALDSLRTNAEKILNARANAITSVDIVHALIEQSVQDDLMVNKLAFNCFIELGL